MVWCHELHATTCPSSQHAIWPRGGRAAQAHYGGWPPGVAATCGCSIHALMRHCATMQARLHMLWLPTTAGLHSSRPPTHPPTQMHVDRYVAGDALARVHIVLQSPHSEHISMTGCMCCGPALFGASSHLMVRKDWYGVRTDIGTAQAQCRACLAHVPMTAAASCAPSTLKEMTTTVHACYPYLHAQPR